MNRLVLLAAAAAAVGASDVPRDYKSSVPQTRGFPEGVRHGALMDAPVPTAAPKPPRFAAMNLLQQRELVSANTCGYFDNNGAWDWFVCANSEAICTNSGTIRQCCHSTECETTTFGSVCLDYSVCDTTRNPNTYCCTYTTAFPFCTSYLWSTKGNDIFTFFGCGEDSTSRVQILYASTEGVDIGLETTSTPSSRGSTVPDPEETDTTTDPTESSTSPNNIPTDPASNPGDNDDDKGGAPVGAIVGGVVGGLAVLSLLALGVFFILRRNRNNNAGAGAGSPNGANPTTQPFMAAHNQGPPMNTGMAGQGMHSPSGYASMGYAPTNTASPYTQNSSPYNPHTSMYGAPAPNGMSPQQTGASNTPSYVTNWATGAQPPPPPQNPQSPPAWGQQHQQGAPVVGWNTGDSTNAPSDAPPPQSKGEVQELASTNPVGQFGGNNRAELG